MRKYPKTVPISGLCHMFTNNKFVLRRNLNVIPRLRHSPYYITATGIRLCGLHACTRVRRHSATCLTPWHSPFPHVSDRFFYLIPSRNHQWCQTAQNTMCGKTRAQQAVPKIVPSCKAAVTGSVQSFPRVRTESCLQAVCFPQESHTTRSRTDRQR